MSLLAPPVIANSEFFTGVVTLCKISNCSVTSWIRSPARNKAVGGVDTSLHLTGEAVDVVLDEPNDIGLLLVTANELNMKIIVYYDHVHLEVKDAIRTNNDVGVRLDRRSPKDLGDESTGQGTKRLTNLTGSERQSKDSKGRKRYYEQGSTVDTENHSLASHSLNHSMAEVCSPNRDRCDSWMDRISSGIFMDGRGGGYRMEIYERPSPDPTRHTLSQRHSGAVFRRKLSWL